MDLGSSWAHIQISPMDENGDRTAPSIEAFPTLICSHDLLEENSLKYPLEEGDSQSVMRDLCALRCSGFSEETDPITHQPRNHPHHHSGC